MELGNDGDEFDIEADIWITGKLDIAVTFTKNSGNLDSACLEVAFAALFGRDVEALKLWTISAKFVGMFDCA